MTEAAEHHHIDPNDTTGKLVGVLAACLAVFLSIFTICAHRSHTESIALQNEANDKWAQYQSKRIRDYQLEMNSELLSVLAANNADARKLMDKYASKDQEYKKELDELKHQADEVLAEDVVMKSKALYFDLAEGVLEISLVMSSLYFISHKKLFPKFGVFFGVIGLVAGIIGLLL